jgi:hypothetical protein
MRQLVLFLLCVPALFGQPRDLGYEANRKVALVVGNSAYPKWPLRNPANDAKAVAQSLTELGFDTQVALDVSLPNLDRAVAQFVSKVKAGDVAAFYYAGHGIQLEGENYLIPVDFNAKDEIDAKYAAYSASRLQERLDKAGARVVLMVLDACRNNPFANTRSMGGGLAAMGSGKGTLIAFATAPGKTADDNPRGNNGLFTTHLIQALREPGLTLDQVFNRVRARVHDASNGQQVPWTVSSVIGDVYLRPGAGVASTSATTASAAPPPAPAPAGNPLTRLASTASQPPPSNPLSRVAPRREEPAADLSGARAAMDRGDFQQATQTAQQALRSDPANKDALQLLAQSYYRTQQWDLFVSTARQSLAAGNTLQFLFGHHHTLTGMHPASLSVSASQVEFRSLGGSCNQQPISVPLANLSAAQAMTSSEGFPYLNVKLLDEKKKQRTLNFVDADSTLTTAASGLPQVVSPPKAAGLVQAVSAVLLGARMPQ